ncbi:MAG: xylulokinase [Candidatus Hydrogenedentota bacterium]
MSTDPEKCILAIDLGTGGPKVALVSTRGEIVGHETEDLEITFLPGGGAEQDPDDWWRAVVRSVRRILERTGIRRDRVVAISVTTQWSLTVPVDREGKPLMHAICWMDTRGAKYCKELKDGPLKIAGCSLGKLVRWLRLCGGLPTDSGADSLAHVLFIKHERPDIYAATHKFLEPMDYLNFRLSGKFAASYGGVFPLWIVDTRDINNLQYHHGLLRLTGLDRDKFADLVPPCRILGTLTKPAAEELGLPENVSVVIGTGDNHSATVGSGAVLDGQGHAYIGTTSWISCHVPYKKVDIFHMLTTMPAGIPGRNIVLAQQGTGGACLNYLKDNILLCEDAISTGQPPDNIFPRLDELAESVPPGSGGLLFTPFLTGALTPVEDRYTRSAFINQSLNTTRAHYVRAVMEGVSYNLRWLLPHVENFVRHRFDVLHFIGGGAQSPVWCQILADVLDRPIRQMEGPRQANVRGAALIASLALGHITLEEIPRLVPVSRTFQPRREHRKTYDEMFNAFVEFYKRNRKLYARLNAGL